MWTAESLVILSRIFRLGGKKLIRVGLLSGILTDVEVVH